MANEDNEYINTSIDSFAIEDDKADDPDQDNKSVLIEAQKYLKDSLIQHNSLDLIDLTEQAKMTPAQQIAVHKYVAQHLRNIKVMIDNKVKELR